MEIKTKYYNIDEYFQYMDRDARRSRYGMIDPETIKEESHEQEARAEVLDTGETN